MFDWIFSRVKALLALRISSCIFHVGIKLFSWAFLRITRKMIRNSCMANR